MKKWLKILGYFIVSVAIITISLVVFKTEIYKINRKPPLVPEHRRILTNLSKEAVEKGDIPIAALLLYDFKIIGQGYNTVLSENNAAGHAEINAINDAIKNIGLEKFTNMDHELLLLITTYEPCEMCKGALKLYDIDEVLFVKEKPLSNSLENIVSELNYQF